MSDIGEPSPWDCSSFAASRLDRLLGRIYDEALRPVRLRITQFTLLGAVVDLGPVSLSELARRTASDRTTVSRAVKILVDRELIALAPGAGRERLANPTAAGRRLYRRAHPLWLGAERSVRELVGEADLVRLRELAATVEDRFRAGDDRR